MFRGNLKMAWTSIRRSKWRSLLTMFGVVIGIVSVVTTVSLGEGVKHQVAGQLKGFGNDLITVRPGSIVSRDNHGNITGVNVLTAITANTLTEPDIQTVIDTRDVAMAVPLAAVSGNATVNGRQYPAASIVATTSDAPNILNQKIQYGAFWDKDEPDAHVVVIGPTVAQELFQENVPVGRSLRVRGVDFVVRGVFEPAASTPFSPVADFNKVIMMPYLAAKELSPNPPQISQILVRPTSEAAIGTVVNDLTHRLQNAHQGDNDFTVLTPQETLQATSSALNLLTGLVAGIAAISLFVGGIGIMNIMLVSVTERTNEIGIRKAVGATNRQILQQFLTEATVLSFAGGVLGILLSLLINYLLRVLTSMTPVVTLPIVIVATAVSIIVGIVFGIVPAVKAAHKDPIEALRYE